ncbi:MAG: FG-GAP-like repeat-containing protein, partial [Dolichospermum sp.]
SGNVVVTTPSGTSNAVAITILGTTPTISGVTTICAGYSTTLTASAGAAYLWSTGATTQSITVSSAGSYTVQTIASGCTSAVSTAAVVSVTALPTFSSFGSSSTAMDNSLVITGTNLTGVTSVKFGATPARFTINNSTQITATVPRVANTGKVSLSNSSGCQSLSTAIPVTRQSSSNVFSSVSTIFNGFNVGVYSVPAFTDIDGDGLIDMITGNDAGTLGHYEQNSANSSSFTLINTTLNGIDIGNASSPTFTDLDGDGLLDLVVGKADGNMSHYEQSTANGTSFTLVTVNFNAINVGTYSTPTFTDLDGDGLLDMLIGSISGFLRHYEQSTSNSTNFTLVTVSFNSIDVG